MVSSNAVKTTTRAERRAYRFILFVASSMPAAGRTLCNRRAA
jgi:hypothetical protein